MHMNIDRMLKRAAECQKFSPPEDALSEIVRGSAVGDEMTESTLDQVAAAVHSHSLWTHPDSQKKK